MPRDSIFDPGGSQTEHSGSTFTGPRADQNSHMPPDAIDGHVDDAEAADLQKLAEFQCDHTAIPDADPLIDVAQAQCERDAKRDPSA